MKSNLPHNHGILIGSFLALLSKEWSNFTWPIQKHSTRNSMKLFFPSVIKRRWVSQSRWPFFGILPLFNPKSCCWRTWKRVPAFCREAGPHPQGPDNAKYALQTSHRVKHPIFYWGIRCRFVWEHHQILDLFFLQIDSSRFRKSMKNSNILVLIVISIEWQKFSWVCFFSSNLSVPNWN